MRVNRIHLRARGDAAVDWQLALYPGYSVVLAPDEGSARRLAALVVALLFPDVGLRGLSEWTGSDAGNASLAVELDSDAYLVSADLGARRLELSRLDPASGRYEPICAGSGDVARRLRAAGLPPVGVFRALCAHSLGVPAREADEAEEADEQLREDATPQPATHVEIARAEAHLAVLRADRDALAKLEEQSRTAFAELEARAPLAEIYEDAELHIAAYRQRLETLEQTRNGIRQTRRRLLDDRTRLANEPERYFWPMIAGAVLTLAGTALTLSGLYPLAGLPAGLPLAVVGAGLALGSVLLRQLAKRRQKKVEVAIAAVRVRDRSAERSFAAESGPARSVMDSLSFRSIEELEQALKEYARCAARVDQLNEEVSEARRAFPAEGQAELTRLEEILSQPDALERLRGAKPELAKSTETEAPGELDASTPESLVVGVASGFGYGVEELAVKLESPLSAQLRTLTDGSFERAELGSDGKWSLAGARREPSAFASLEDGDASAVLLAFQLALLEALAPEKRLPLLVGPEPICLGAQNSERRMARALRRVGAAVQVLQITAGSDHWSDQAARTLRLS